MKVVKMGRFQFQKRTKKEWEDSEIILLDGELAFESDTTKFKIGDGKSDYKDLEYIQIGQVKFDDLTPEEQEKVKGEKGDSVSIEDINTKNPQNTIITFSDGKEISIKHGKDGEKGKDAEPLTIKKEDVDEDGNTLITFSDGNKITVKKGKDGTIDISEWSDEQKSTFRDNLKIPTPDLSEYVKEKTLEERLQSINISEQLESYATKEDLKSVDVSSQIKDLATKSELSGYQEKGDYASKYELSDKVDRSEIRNFVTDSQVRQIVSSSAPTVKAGTSIDVSDGTISLKNVNGSNIKIWIGSAYEYGRVYSKDMNTLYFIRE